MQTKNHTQPRWIVRSGTSSATVRAPDIGAARERAAAIGFKAPQSIALATDAQIDAAAAVSAYRALHV